MELTKLTYAMIKPDAVAAKHTGKIIDEIEHNGFEIVRLQKVIVSQELAEEFYAEHKEKPFFGELVEFVISGPVIIMALHKENAITAWRDLIGATDPAKAAVGTIRNSYGTSIGNNAVHGSADSESAVRELGLFFPELFGYDSDEQDDECSKDECSDNDDCCMN
jgi:nucleoside-diphosphate kinase